MAQFQRLLSTAFPWMAITGLLLAGWGLIVTPDELKGNRDAAALWGANAASMQIPHATKELLSAR